MAEEPTMGEVRAVCLARIPGIEKAFDAALAAHDAQVKAEAWGEARKRVSDAHPRCTDECDMCIARDEILDDLSANPYRTEATR